MRANMLAVRMLRHSRRGERIAAMNERDDTTRHRLVSVLTDVQFWIPVIVLIGGLLVRFS